MGLQFLASDAEQNNLFIDIKWKYEYHALASHAPDYVVNGTISHMTAVICDFHRQVDFFFKNLARERADCENPAVLELFDEAVKDIEQTRDTAQYRFEVFADQWRKLVEIISTGPQAIVHHLELKIFEIFENIDCAHRLP